MVTATRPTRPSYELIARRCLDLGVAGLGLVLLAPLFLFLAICIRLDSPGPVFFTQWRVGRGGRLFRLWKFRTMVAGADRLGPSITSATDRRRTRCGRWLRRSKLDELPQLWNVLRGDMTLVGPRPEVPEWVEHWPQEAADTILSVRPGITDPVTLSLRNEEALLAEADDAVAFYRDVMLADKTANYLRYLKSRTLRSDLIVLWWTPITVLTGTHRLPARYSWATAQD